MHFIATSLFVGIACFFGLANAANYQVIPPPKTETSIGSLVGGFEILPTDGSVTPIFVLDNTGNPFVGYPVMMAAFAYNGLKNYDMEFNLTMKNGVAPKKFTTNSNSLHDPQNGGFTFFESQMYSTVDDMCNIFLGAVKTANDDGIATFVPATFDSTIAVTAEKFPGATKSGFAFSGMLTYTPFTSIFDSFSKAPFSGSYVVGGDVLSKTFDFPELNTTYFPEGIKPTMTYATFDSSILTLPKGKTEKSGDGLTYNLAFKYSVHNADGGKLTKEIIDNAADLQTHVHLIKDGKCTLVFPAANKKYGVDDPTLATLDLQVDNPEDLRAQIMVTFFWDQLGQNLAKKTKFQMDIDITEVHKKDDHDNHDHPHHGGLSSGAKAGIAFAVIFGIAGIGFGAFIYIRNKRREESAYASF